MADRKTYSDKIIKRLQELEVGKKIEIKPLVERLWGRHDFFIQRAFDVHFCKAKKALQQQNIHIERRSGRIKRVQ